MRENIPMAHFCRGVSKDLESYENFFRSDNGGAWGSSEIATRRTGWTSLGLYNELFSRRMNGGLDYAMIVFSGHGYAERDGEPMFELSENEVISLSGICSFLPAQKMLMIADSCQGIIKLNEGGPIASTRHFSSISDSDSRRRCQEAFDKKLAELPKGMIVTAASTSVGEEANDDPRRGGCIPNLFLQRARKY